MGDLVLKKTTTGQITLTPQDVAGNQTVTIPASTGTLSIANTSTSGGIFFGGATSGVLYQDATNLFWDDTNNALGIGTNSPNTYGQLAVVNSGTAASVLAGTGTSQYNGAYFTLSAPDASNNYGRTTLVHNLNAGVSDLTNTSFLIQQRNNSGAYIANVYNIDYKDSAHIWYAPNSGTERMRINGGAPILCLAGGNATATGTGIAFPATQSASSDVNTLDDYEEGTFTPGISFGGGTTGITYGNRLGRYIKVGRVVTFNLYCAMTNKGSSTGSINVTGLPFTAQNISYGYNNHTLWINNTNSTLAGVFEGYIAAGQTQVVYEKLTSGFYGTLTGVTNSDVSNNTDVMCGGMYYTDN